jgi:hypothetical protein
MPRRPRRTSRPLSYDTGLERRRATCATKQRYTSEAEARSIALMNAAPGRRREHDAVRLRHLRRLAPHVIVTRRLSALMSSTRAASSAVGGTAPFRALRERRMVELRPVGTPGCADACLCNASAPSIRAALLLLVIAAILPPAEQSRRRVVLPFRAVRDVEPGTRGARADREALQLGVHGVWFGCPAGQRSAGTKWARLR